MAAKNFITLAVLLLLSRSVLSQNLPEAPKPEPERWLNRHTITQLSLIGTAFALDGYTSTAGAWDWPGRETNPILGNHASAGKTAAYFSGSFLAVAGTNYLLRRHNRIRWIGAGILVTGETIFVIRNVHGNLRAPSLCPNNPACTTR